MIVAEISGDEVLSSSTRTLDLVTEEDLADRLREIGAGLLVCGGIRREFREELVESGIRVIENVAGEADEIVAALAAGRLGPGYGLEAVPDPARRVRIPEVRAVTGPPPVDCVACEDRGCLHGRPCARRLAGVAWGRATPRERRITECAQDVSAQTDPRLCRIAELTHFALEMGYGRIGLAFCRELFHEVDVLVPLLSRFFTVVPVCCRVGPPEAGDTCRPLLQAAVLERAGTELNVIAGLCLGSDLLFTSRSHAPVTTLFVRDRTLAHNPVGAIYTRYHREQISPEGAARVRRERGARG